MAKTIQHRDLASLLFGQQHLLTQSFFIARHGQYHTVDLSQSPHFLFLQDSHGRPMADHPYSQYLDCSWEYYYGKEGNTAERRRQQMELFLELRRELSVRRHLGEDAIIEPIKLCIRPDGRTVIVDGNHRAAIALSLGLDVRAEYVLITEQLVHVVTVPDEFYGSKRLNLPYQGIFEGGRELVKGRRPDMLERMSAISDADLRGRTVLELGCNLGGNCYLAAERGASAVTGVDVSPAITSAAVRLNAYLAKPCLFIAWDLNEPLTCLPAFDTVFCFSVADHLQQKAALVETLRHTVGRVLYFEGHAGTDLKHYDYLLNTDNFSEVELIGYGRDGIDSDTSSRPLFRCEARRPGLAADVQSRSESSPGVFSIEGLVSQINLATIHAKDRSGRRGPIFDLEAIERQIEAAASDGTRLILVDEEQFRSDLRCAKQCVPFPEREGQYWGPPSDDAAAVAELERLRGAGAASILFVATSFWWLEHYRAFAAHLRSDYRCVLENEHVIMFDLLQS